MQVVSETFSDIITGGIHKPITRVKIYPTYKTVKSLGFKCAFYDSPVVPTWATENLLFPTSSGDLDNIIEPSTVIAFDWGIGGSPDVVSKGHSFAIRYSGFFFARYTGIYRFYLDCARHNRLRIKFDGSYLTRKDPDDDSTVDNWNLTGEGTKKELYSDTGSLTKGTWYEIYVEYWVPQIRTPQAEPNFLCVKYQEPDTTTNLDEWGNSGGDIVTDYQSDYPMVKVLSAGVVNCSTISGNRVGVDENSVEFLQGTELTQRQDISGSRDADEAAQYQVTVPVPNANVLDEDVIIGANEVKLESAIGFPTQGVAIIGTDKFFYRGRTNYHLLDVRQSGDLSIQSAHSKGDIVSIYGAGDYPYNPTDKSYGVIKTFQLCTIEAGYQSIGEVDYYTNRITGFIFPNPILTRTKESDKLQFMVTDFRSDLITKYFTSHPDYASYASARYYEDHFLSQPNGITRPVAYDRWNVAYAVKDILMKANIDPVLLCARERKNINGGANFIKDYGDYLIKGNEERGNQTRLDSKPNYGRPMEVNAENADDQYNWFFGHGEKYIEGISEIQLNFLYKFGFQPDGKTIFAPTNTASITFNDDKIESGGIDYEIPPPIVVTYPNNVVELTRGDNCNITWNGDSSGNVKIQLYIAYYLDYNTWSKWYRHPKYGVIANLTTDDGSYSWTIPTDIGYIGGHRGFFQKHRFKIKIIDLDNTDNFDFTNYYFTLTD